MFFLVNSSLWTVSNEGASEWSSFSTGVSTELVHGASWVSSIACISNSSSPVVSRFKDVSTFEWDGKDVLEIMSAGMLHFVLSTHSGGTRGSTTAMAGSVAFLSGVA